MNLSRRPFYILQKLNISTISSKIHAALFALLLALLILPLLQSQTNLFDVDPLIGAISEPKKDTFNNQDWFSGKYQEGIEKYFNESFGFRNTCIRINNQLAFDIEKKANANGVIIGKNNYLYEYNYIKAFYGTDYIGYDSIHNRMQQLKYIQDTLKSLHKNLMVIFAPGKGSFYPEYFPDSCKKEKKITNFETYLNFVQKFNIEHIDFNNYFIKNKYTAPYPLYPQYGIHWSNYGMCLAADSIIHHIEKLRKIDIPDIYWNTIDFDQPRIGDYDIAGGMNIFFKLKSFEMAYPQVQIESDSGKSKPSVLVVSDSFYWGLYELGLSKTFSNNHFWFYNNLVFPESYQSTFTTKQVNLKDEIANHDIIILMATESSLPKLGWGFIENTYNIFKK